MRKDKRVFSQKIQLPFKVKRPILAVGSQTKNTVCFAEGDFAYLSPLHADLTNPQDFLSFEKTLNYFLKKHPKVIAYDLHPEYQSSKYALNLSPVTYPRHKTRRVRQSRHRTLAGRQCAVATLWRNLSPIQHHHAHIASCMVDNGLRNQKVIGVAFDGTGMGTDNTLWGAEFFLCDYKSFQRRAHLKEVALLGGEKAILEPWRLLVFWGLKPRQLKKIAQRKWRVLKKMYLSGFNALQSSSMGRLFDAVGSLVLEKDKVNFEAELAMALEKKAQGSRLKDCSYKFKIIKKDGQYIIDPLPVFKQIIKDLKENEPKERIAYRFHFSVAEMVRKICCILRKEHKINRVVLSGGVFQNSLLLRLSLDLLYKEAFNVFIHKQLSCNDSGISLGQAVIANFRS